MSNTVYKPLIGKMFYYIAVPTGIFLLAMTLLTISAPIMLLVMIPVDLFTAYFLVSPLFGYVELKEESVFIKFGFFLTRDIPYSSIRGIEITRKWYSDSMLSLKNAMEHVNIKYAKFDVISVSVKDNARLASELQEKISR